MDPWLSFLSGALGASLGAWVTLYRDRKNREEANRLRYSPEVRQLFLDFLAACDERAIEVKKQVQAAHNWSQDRSVVVPRLDTTEELETKLHRVQDVVPEGRLAGLAAHFLFNNVVALGLHSHKSWQEPIDPSTNEDWQRDWKMYLDSVDIVRRAYMQEVGAVTTGRTWR